MESENIKYLKNSWHNYREQVVRFEIEKERILRQQCPSISEDLLRKKLSNAINRKFRLHAKVLLMDHMIFTGFKPALGH